MNLRLKKLQKNKKYIIFFFSKKIFFFDKKIINVRLKITSEKLTKNDPIIKKIGKEIKNKKANFSK